MFLSRGDELDRKGSASGIGPSDVFRFTNVWTVHLTFTPEQWEAMEPKQGARPQFRPGGGGSFLQGPEGGRNGIASAFGIVFNYVHADLEFGTNVFKDVGVRIKPTIRKEPHQKNRSSVSLSSVSWRAVLTMLYSHRK
jgi:hypothetical protein